MGLFKSSYLFLGDEAQGDPEGLIHWNTFCKVSLWKQFKQKQESYFRFLYPASILFVPLLSPHDLLLKQNLVRPWNSPIPQKTAVLSELETNWICYIIFILKGSAINSHIIIDEAMPWQCFS